MGRVGLAGVSAFLMVTGAVAQEGGDPRQGQEVARQVCARCHAVGKGEGSSPVGNAPTFETIARTPGMSPLALTVALRSSHETMPNLVLAPDEHNDVVAYILSLKGGG